MKIFTKFEGLSGRPTFYCCILTISYLITPAWLVEDGPSKNQVAETTTSTTIAPTTTTTTEPPEPELKPVDLCSVKTSEKFNHSPVVNVQSNNQTIFCYSTEQINWIFSNLSKLSLTPQYNASILPFEIESQMVICKEPENFTLDVNESTIKYFFQSRLALKLNSYNYLNSSGMNSSTGETFVLCHSFAPVNSSKIPRVQIPGANLTLNNGTIRVKNGNFSLPRKMSECKRKRSGSSKKTLRPKILLCENLVDCQLLAQWNLKTRGSCEVSPSENDCSLDSIPWDNVDSDNKSGIIFCQQDKNEAIHYVPFIPALQNSQQNYPVNSTNLTTIHVISHNSSTYGKHLHLSLTSSQEANNITISRRTGGQLNCTGPKFLFLPGFYWTVSFGNSVFHSRGNSEVNFTVSPTARTADGQNYTSTLTISPDTLNTSSNLMVTCEAAVRNQNFLVNTSRQVELQVYTPVINGSIACIAEGQFMKYSCSTPFGSNIAWTWHNATGHEWVKAGFSNLPNELVLTTSYACPLEDLGCTGTLDNGIRNSHYFLARDCIKHRMDNNDSCPSTTTTTTTTTTQGIPVNMTVQLQQENELERSQRIFSPTVYIAICCSVGICLLLFVPFAVVLIRKNREQKARLKMSDDDINEFLRGNETSQATDPSALFLPYNPELEIPRDKLVLDSKILGSGAFAKVIQGQIGDRKVAVKTVNKSADLQYFKALLSEIKIMSFVGRHENVVELVGACTSQLKKREVYVVYEFCSNGNAIQFIRSNRNAFVNQLKDDAYMVHENKQVRVSRKERMSKIRSLFASSENVAIMPKFSSRDLVRWSFEIACGMDFIAQSKVYHGDLAGRNILLDGNLVAKVGDFGLSRQLFQYSVYVQKQECPLPLKWLAIESLRDLEFSIQSDVWSYAVCLWEFFSLGCHPYPGLEWNYNAWKVLSDGERMDKPEYATTAIYEIMRKCWHSNPNERPTFSQLKTMFEGELKKMQELPDVSKTQEGKAFLTIPTINFE